MSWQPAADADLEHAPCPDLATVISPRAHDLGGFTVRRVLPAMQRRSVGPFVFWDHMGPATFAPGRGIDVRPHPHIGLATVTYLFAGEILHRDSLGSVQAIRPGAINWMTAGRGIVHSERTPPDVRAAGGAVAGIQAWVALPRAAEECSPAFVHHAAETLPVADVGGATVRVLVGSLFGQRSPVATSSQTLYADVALTAGATFRLPGGVPERAVHVADGQIAVGGRAFGPGQMLVFARGDEVPLVAPGGARLLVLGGEPLDGPRHMWWNFVSTSLERIEQAKAEWKAGRFAPVPGETESIPLPER